jgi:hypothetical protein
MVGPRMDSYLFPVYIAGGKRGEEPSEREKSRDSSDYFTVSEVQVRA